MTSSGTCDIKATPWQAEGEGRPSKVKGAREGQDGLLACLGTNYPKEVKGGRDVMGVK